jgi:xanthine dehydrogenase YagR molybdenum-binding subunit
VTDDRRFAEVSLQVDGEPRTLSLGTRIGIVGVPAAIGNAVWHATRVRVRDLPIRPDKVLFR